MRRSLNSATTLKHSLVSKALSTAILDGKYKIGDLLPSELELSQRFGVSRNTIRAALRSLQDIGLIASQQGVGSVVQRDKLVSHYSYTFNSAEDLLQYAKTTSGCIVARTEIEVDAELALSFGCKTGEHWWRIRTVRTDVSTNNILAFSEIHIPLLFGSVLDEADETGKPIFTLIEARFGQQITEIEQDITYVQQVTNEEASYLKIAPGSPAIEITRRYLGVDGRLLETTRSIYPAETFKYSMRLELRHGD